MSRPFDTHERLAFLDAVVDFCAENDERVEATLAQAITARHPSVLHVVRNPDGGLMFGWQAAGPRTASGAANAAAWRVLDDTLEAARGGGGGSALLPARYSVVVQCHDVSSCESPLVARAGDAIDDVLALPTARRGHFTLPLPLPPALAAQASP
mmetsp:Transcript_30039/g.73170  ORF Transcript_30039/g.73170 Transcript_30039/m.73170 type:complete len:154 (+) Transcript_30039:3620-4081(+)